MEYCIIRQHVVKQDNSLHGLINKAIFYTIDKRDTGYYLMLGGREDTISYSLEFTLEEVNKEVLHRLKEILINNGWIFYKRM